MRDGEASPEADSLRAKLRRLAAMGECFWRLVLGGWWLVRRGRSRSRAVSDGRREGEVNGQAPNGRDARWPRVSAERARRPLAQCQRRTGETLVPPVAGYACAEPLRM